MKNAFAKTCNNKNNEHKMKPLFQFSLCDLIYLGLTTSREQVPSALQVQLPYHPKADPRVPLLILPLSL